MLQAHAPDLFACGIAKSGAYNRTLTPFGFQAEERTIWQAPEVYNAMSPFMQVRTLSPVARMRTVRDRSIVSLWHLENACGHPLHADAVCLPNAHGQ